MFILVKSISQLILSTVENSSRTRTYVSSLVNLILIILDLVERGTPRNIQVYNPTPNSMNVRWEPAPGPVQQYRINYSSLSGPRPSESVSNLVFIQFLKSVWRIFLPSMSVEQ